MELHYKIAGSLLIVLALMHVIIPKYFKWEQELTSLSLITRQIVYVHTFFIGFIVLLMGLLCVNYTHELIHDPFGRVISLGLFGFWLTRLFFQMFVYSPKLWRKKGFETIVHVGFSTAWLYFSAVFLLGYLSIGTTVPHGETQFNHSRGYYGTPYDSTQGVPGYVFAGVWFIIILFFIRLGWEYRDKIFKKRD